MAVNAPGLPGRAAPAGAGHHDHTLVPTRLTPGFEHRLSRGAMVVACGATALRVAIGAMLTQER